MKSEKNRSGIVKMMRNIRDEMNADIMNMDLNEEKAFIKMRLSELKMRKDVMQHAISS